MGYYFKTDYINGIMGTYPQSCPVCNNTNLQFPVYLNAINISGIGVSLSSGLVQPWGPVGESGYLIPSGIARPNDGHSTQIYQFFRPATSGLTMTFPTSIYSNEFVLSGIVTQQQKNISASIAFASGSPSGPVPSTTYYQDINWYQEYWYCNVSNTFFLYPVPSGLLGNTSSVPSNSTSPYMLALTAASGSILVSGSPIVSGIVTSGVQFRTP